MTRDYPIWLDFIFWGGITFAIFGIISAVLLVAGVGTRLKYAEAEKRLELQEKSAALVHRFCKDHEGSINKVNFDWSCQE